MQQVENGKFCKILVPINVVDIGDNLLYYPRKRILGGVFRLDSEGRKAYGRSDSNYSKGDFNHCKTC